MKTQVKIFGLLLIGLFFCCKNITKSESLDFKLIPKNSYFINSYNGISIYRNNDTKKLMTGYFVVGNKFTKWEEFNVTDGILNGDYIIFHNNGNKFSHSNYLNGKLHGDEKTYSLSGALSRVSHFNHGIRFGKDVSYFENGQLRSESKIEDEEVVESVTYNSIGKIESQMFIKDGRKITQCIKGGRIFMEQITSTYDNFEAMKFYNDNGGLKVFFRILDEDEKIYFIELDDNEDEIKRIDFKSDPENFIRYRQYFNDFN